jgi:hypothetical protein
MQVEIYNNLIINYDIYWILYDYCLEFNICLENNEVNIPRWVLNNRSKCGDNPMCTRSKIGDYSWSCVNFYDCSESGVHYRSKLGIFRTCSQSSSDYV